MTTNGEQGGAPQTGGGGSDPFIRVSRVSDIPAVHAVPETREEIARRRTVRIATWVAIVAVVLVTVFISYRIVRASRIASAVVAFERDGQKESLQHALDLLSGNISDDEEGLRARLSMSGAMDVGVGTVDGALRDVAAMSSDASASVDGAMARVLAALAGGQPSDAAKTASALVPKGNRAAEVAYTRALAALSVGNMAFAKAAADLATDREGKSMRYAVLAAWIHARLGDPKAAEALLAPFAEAPAAKVMQARLLLLRGELANGAKVVTPLVSDTTTAPSVRAWAKLVAAREAAQSLGKAAPRELVRGALDGAPRGDESYAVLLVETLTIAGMWGEAKKVLDGLPQDASVNFAERELARFRLAIEQKDVATADVLAPKVDAFPGANLLLGRYDEMRGQTAKARQHYGAALSDAQYGIEAATRLAELELGVGKPKDALRAIEPALARVPTDPAVVTVAALAMGRAGDSAKAMDVVAKALVANPKDGALLAAKARVQLSMNDANGALATAKDALLVRAEDPDIQSLAGDAARKLGRADVAMGYYNAALALSESHPESLVGKFDLLLQAQDVDGARTVFGKLEQANVKDESLGRLLARYYVLTSAGRDGGREVEKIIDREHMRRDAEFWRLRGQLHYQAEEFGPAARAFGMSVGFDRENGEAVALRAFPQLKLKLKAPAKKSVEDAEEFEHSHTVPPRQRALFRAARARYELLMNHVAMATKMADKALELDPNCVEGMMVLADLSALRGKAPVALLERASKVPGTNPETWARLALVSTDESVGCKLAVRYRNAAPAGQHIPALRRFPLRCE